MNQSHILIVDDDPELASLLSDYLLTQGFICTLVVDGIGALDWLRSKSADLVVLDVMMPQLDGFETLQQLRRFSDVPVLMLTARADDIHRIGGLEAGADDYLPKPCNPRELVARIRAILRRVELAGARPPGNPGAEYQVANIKLRTCDRSVTVGSQICSLTVAEFNMLLTLMENTGRVVSKEELTEKGLGRKLELYDRSTDMHISNLRKKLHLGSEGHLRTVRGKGYMMVSDINHQ